MKNFLEETLADLARCGKQPADVRWIGTLDFWVSWPEFAQAADFSYDNGFGGVEIAESLSVVGDDWWLERYEYDGAEQWVYKTLPTKPDEHRPTLRRDDLRD